MKRAARVQEPPSDERRAPVEGASIPEAPPEPHAVTRSQSPSIAAERDGQGDDSDAGVENESDPVLAEARFLPDEPTTDAPEVDAPPPADADAPLFEAPPELAASLASLAAQPPVVPARRPAPSSAGGDAPAPRMAREPMRVLPQAAVAALESLVPAGVSSTGAAQTYAAAARAAQTPVAQPPAGQTGSMPERRGRADGSAWPVSPSPAPAPATARGHAPVVTGAASPVGAVAAPVYRDGASKVSTQVAAPTAQPAARVVAPPTSPVAPTPVPVTPTASPVGQAASRVAAAASKGETIAVAAPVRAPVMTSVPAAAPMSKPARAATEGAATASSKGSVAPTAAHEPTVAQHAARATVPSGQEAPVEKAPEPQPVVRGRSVAGAYERSTNAQPASAAVVARTGASPAAPNARPEPSAVQAPRAERPIVTDASRAVAAGRHPVAREELAATTASTPTVDAGDAIAEAAAPIGAGATAPDGEKPRPQVRRAAVEQSAPRVEAPSQAVTVETVPPATRTEAKAPEQAPTPTRTQARATEQPRAASHDAASAHPGRAPEDRPADLLAPAIAQGAESRPTLARASIEPTSGGQHEAAVQPPRAVTSRRDQEPTSKATPRDGGQLARDERGDGAAPRTPVPVAPVEAPHARTQSEAAEPTRPATNVRDGELPRVAIGEAAPVESPRSPAQERAPQIQSESRVVRAEATRPVREPQDDRPVAPSDVAPQPTRWSPADRLETATLPGRGLSVAAREEAPAPRAAVADLAPPIASAPVVDVPRAEAPAARVHAIAAAADRVRAATRFAGDGMTPADDDRRPVPQATTGAPPIAAPRAAELPVSAMRHDLAMFAAPFAAPTPADDRRPPTSGELPRVEAARREDRDHERPAGAIDPDRRPLDLRAAEPAAVAPVDEPKAPPPLSPQESVLARAAEDPALNVSVLARSAHMNIESEEGDLALHLRMRDGNADLRIGGSMAAMFEARAPEARSALAGEGIGLGRFELEQQGAGQGQGNPQHRRDVPDESAAPAAKPYRPAATTTTEPEVRTLDGRIHVTA